MGGGEGEWGLSVLMGTEFQVRKVKYSGGGRW